MSREKLDESKTIYVQSMVQWKHTKLFGVILIVLTIGIYIWLGHF